MFITENYNINIFVIFKQENYLFPPKHLLTKTKLSSKIWNNFCFILHNLKNDWSKQVTKKQ